MNNFELVAFGVTNWNMKPQNSMRRVCLQLRSEPRSACSVCDG